MQHELQQRPEFIALQKELAELNGNIAPTNEETGRKLRAQRKDLYVKRQQLIKKGTEGAPQKSAPKTSISRQPKGWSPQFFQSRSPYDA
jgi:hypothetical protein